MNHTCLCLPAEAGTHLPIPEGWKAEFSLVARDTSAGQRCFKDFLAEVYTLNVFQLVFFSFLSQMYSIILARQ